MIRARRFINFYRQWRRNHHTVYMSVCMAWDLSRLVRNPR